LKSDAEDLLDHLRNTYKLLERVYRLLESYERFSEKWDAKWLPWILRKLGEA
jgi:hypothetical protein